MADRFHGVLDVAGRTDTGRVRGHNEDAFGIDAELGLLLVCDGMGGHAAGEVASHTAVETIVDFLYEYDPDLALTEHEAAPDDLPPAAAPSRTAGVDVDATVRSDSGADATPRRSLEGEVLREAVIRTNQRLVLENRRRGYAEGTGMGTTLAGAWMASAVPASAEYAAFVFHVGDSRVYRFTNGRLLLLTRDHTLFENWRAMGGEGEPPKRNIIMRALGPMSDVEPDVALVGFDSGDLVVVCSDGLSSMAADDAIAEVLRARSGDDPDAIAGALVDLANGAGGKDNVTVVVGRWA